MALESDLNRLIVSAYELEDEITSAVPEESVTLYRPEIGEDVKRLAKPHAIGCMMGRYSLDKPGLIYAHGGNKGFDTEPVQAFPADQDGILPLTEFEWFGDDAAKGIDEFVGDCLAEGTS